MSALVPERFRQRATRAVQRFYLFIYLPVVTQHFRWQGVSEKTEAGRDLQIGYVVNTRAARQALSGFGRAQSNVRGRAR